MAQNRQTKETDEKARWEKPIYQDYANNIVKQGGDKERIRRVIGAGVPDEVIDRLHQRAKDNVKR